MTAEKFTTAELAIFREELLKRVPDPFELAEILQGFLVDRGFGISTNSALDAASKVGAAGCSLAALHAELEAVALVM
jgi:hypothetical protein